jgi:flagellar motor switch protein FliN
MDTDLNLPDLNADDIVFGGAGGVLASDDSLVGSKTASDLEQLFDVPVTVSAVLGNTRLPIGDLLKLAPGSILEIDRQVGEAIDVFVNNRLCARGEIVLVDDKLGVTLTEIIKGDK